MKHHKQYEQTQVFYQFLYKCQIQYTNDNIPLYKVDQLKQFSQGLFYSQSTEKHPMKFENFVCLYAGMVA